MKLQLLKTIDQSYCWAENFVIICTRIRHNETFIHFHSLFLLFTPLSKLSITIDYGDIGRKL